MPNVENSECSQLKTKMVDLQNLINGYQSGGSTNIAEALQAAQTELKALTDQYAHNGCTALPPMPPRTVNILMVMDGSSMHVASFGPGSPTDEYFGLSEVIRTLTNYGSGLLGTMAFRITKAHRNMDPGNFDSLSAADQALFRPDFQTFTFDQAGLDLNQFDEIWLFGVGGPSEAPALTDSELLAIATFMDGGGGVFATGDHDNLGMQLCGRIPRVRTMRKWYTASDPIPPELGAPPMAPSGYGSSRNDTTRAGHNDPGAMPDGTPVFWFDNQSDDLPQPITPATLTSVSVTGMPVTYTHPVLLTNAGPLDVLPDHMHEGEVITPWDLTMKATFKGQTFTEYPVNQDGSQELPVIIATGQVVKHVTDATPFHPSDDHPVVVQAKNSFGVIGVYDGNATDLQVGRVVVDSTWHHFFDLNLIGDPVARLIYSPGEDPSKLAGFTSSASGLAALTKIKAYFINIAVWLARQHPPRVQQQPSHPHMLVAAIYRLRTSQPLSMVVRKGIEYSAENILEIGAMGRAALRRFVSEEMLVDWLHDYLRQRYETKKTPARDALSADHRQARVLLDAALGAAVVSVAQHFVARGPLELASVQRELELHVERGVRRSIEIVREKMKKRVAAIETLSSQLHALSG